MRRETSLPAPQITALLALLRRGEQTTSGLAAAERMRPQSMAHTVGELERNGLVTRRRDPADGRRRLLSLTPAGEAAINEYLSAGDAWLVAGLQQLSEAERATLAEAIVLLRRLSER